MLFSSKSIDVMKKSSTIIFVLMLAMVSSTFAGKYEGYYTNLPFELEQVQEVIIPDYTVTLTDFGAIGDGETMCTEAFANAIKH